MDISNFRKIERTKRTRKLLDQRMEAMDDMAATHRILSGQFMINAAGEAKVEIDFPYKFSEKPLMSFGFEMQAGEVYVRGQMATASAMVMDWKTEERPPISRFYTGCTIGIVNEGPSNQKLIGVWHAAGMAYANPTS